MAEKEEDEETRGKEVNGACGLLTAEDFHEGGNNGRDGGRHGEACDDYKREDYENHGGVSDALEEVVRTLRVVGRREVFPEVLSDETGDDVKQAV